MNNCCNVLSSIDEEEEEEVDDDDDDAKEDDPPVDKNPAGYIVDSGDCCCCCCCRCCCWTIFDVIVADNPFNTSNTCSTFAFEKSITSKPKLLNYIKDLRTFKKRRRSGGVLGGLK